MFTQITVFGWAWVLWKTNGWYSPGYLFTFPALILTGYWADRRFGDRVLTPKQKTVFALAFFSLLGTIRPQLLYPQSSLFLAAIQAAFIMVLIVAAWLAIRDQWRHQLSILLFAVSALVLVFGILCSPYPLIDVWIYIQQAVDGIQNGINPYSIAFPSVYAGKPPAAFPYSPVTLLYLTPFHAILGDVRYGLVAALLISGLLCLGTKSDKSSKYLYTSLILLFPSTLNVIEQSWIDPISLIPLAMAIRGLKSKKNSWFIAGVLLLPAVKHYNFAFVPFLLLAHPSFRNWKKALALFAGSVAFFVTQFIAFTPSSKTSTGFLKEMLFPTFDLTEIRHFSLGDWLIAHQIPISANEGLLISLLIGVTSVAVFIWKKRHLPSDSILWGSYALMVFFLLYPNTALNYVWFAVIAWWMNELSRPEESTAPLVNGLAPIDALYFVTRIFLIFGMEPYISDVGLYFKYFSEWHFGGLMPYRDFSFEYPPFAWIPIVFPASLFSINSESLLAYRFCFMSLIVAADFSIFRFFRRISEPKAAYFYVFSILAMAHLVLDRIDLIVGFFLILPLFPFARTNRFFSQDIIIGMGGLFKISPMIVSGLPELLKKRGIFRATLGALVSVSLFVIGMAWMLDFSDGKPTLFNYHSLRGIQVESLIGNVALFLATISPELGISVGNNYGAQHLSGFPDSVVLFGKLLSIVSVFATFGWVVRNALVHKKVELAQATFLMILTFVTFNTVLSPQFILWLIPVGIFASIEQKRKYDLYTLFLISVITGVHFHFYWSYVQKEIPFLLNLMLRNLLLVGLWAVNIYRISLNKDKSMTR